jgi:16S rRNA processing protein RimM
MQTPERLLIGRVGGVFGVRGELKVEIETDFPERFKGLKRVFVCGSEYEAEGSRLHAGRVLLKLKGIDDPNAAAELDRCEVEVAYADRVQLPPGQYFIHEIEGLRAETVDGELLGTVSEVLQTGANDVYIIATPDGGELLLPAIPQVIKEVDLAGGRLLVVLMEGLR